MVVFKAIGCIFKMVLAFFLQMLSNIFIFLIGISSIVSHLWMLLVFVLVCFHFMGFDKGMYSVFSDGYGIMALAIITGIILFAQTLFGFLGNLCLDLADWLFDNL